MIADEHRDAVGAAGDADLDRAALTVLDGVDDQVAQHPLEPHVVHLGDDPADGQHGHGAAPPFGQRPGPFDDPLDDRHDVEPLSVEGGRSRVVPADLEQLGEQFLEPAELGLQQLGRARRRRREAGPRLVQHVGCHPDRRERGAQLVTDIRHEALLHPGEVLELADLGLKRLGHRVERRGQPGDLVLAAHRHPLLEPAGGEALSGLRRQPHRQHDLPGDQPRDEDQQQHQEHAGGGRGPADEGERLLLGGQREQVEQRIAAQLGVEDGADDEAGPPAGRRRDRSEDVGERLVGQARHQAPRQIGRPHPGRGESLGLATGALQDDGVLPTGGAAVGQGLRDALQLRLDDAPPEVAAHGLGLRLQLPGLRLGQRRPGLGADQPPPDLVEQQRGEQGHHDRADEQGRHHHPELQVSAPPRRQLRGRRAQQRRDRQLGPAL